MHQMEAMIRVAGRYFPVFALFLDLKCTEEALSIYNQ